MDEQTRGQLIETAARALYEADAIGDDLWHLAEPQVRGWYEQMAAAVIDALQIEHEGDTGFTSPADPRPVRPVFSLGVLESPPPMSEREG